MASTLSYPVCYTAADAADYLYRLPRSADGVGLFRAAELLDELGNPQNAVPTVHVAGTAGKGSVVAFLSAILTAHGFRVGAHLSPHVHSLLERFQINAVAMGSPQFVDAVGRLQAAIAAGMSSPARTPAFFEATNAVAFSAFASDALD